MMPGLLLFKGGCPATFSLHDTKHECGEPLGHVGSHRCTFHFPGESPRRCRFFWADFEDEAIEHDDRVDAVHV